MGLLITAAISVGNCGDRDGLHVLLYNHKQLGFRLEKVFGDQGYEGQDFKVEIKE